MDCIIAAAMILRKKVFIRFIDGPTFAGLGKDYIRLSWEEKNERMISFLRKAGDKCAAAGLILAVEFLRPVEDKVVGGTQAMIDLLKAVNHPWVKMHFDVFHSVECGENPTSMIRLAKKWIVYLHLHGDLRIAPGAPGDLRHWEDIIDAVGEIDSGVEKIPVVPEPFGEETIREEPSLGEGLPVPPPLAQYLDIAYETFDECGLEIAA